MGQELTSAEATPYHAGLRIALAFKGNASALPDTLAGLSPHLMPHERQCLVTHGDDHFMRWYVIGTAGAVFMLMVKHAKGE